MLLAFISWIYLLANFILIVLWFWLKFGGFCLIISVVCDILLKNLNFSVTSYVHLCPKIQRFSTVFLWTFSLIAAFNQFAQFVLHFADFTMNVYKDMKYKLQSFHNDYKDKILNHKFHQYYSGIHNIYKYQYCSDILG